MSWLEGHSLGWVLALAAALGATGLVAGVLAGLLGVGGGIVIVPVLYHLFGVLAVDESVRMHLAVGTSLATIIPTSFMSARAHKARGNLNPTVLKGLAPAVLVGVAVGAALSHAWSGRGLTAVFAVVAMVVALHMAFAGPRWQLGAQLPGAWGLRGIGVLIGTLSTLMGIGGGTLSVPILSAYRTPMHTAVGTGAALGMVISIPGALSYLVNGWGAERLPPASLGYINLLGVALIIPATMLATGWGVKLAQATDAKKLKRWFALFLAITSLRMAYNLLTR